MTDPIPVRTVGILGLGAAARTFHLPLIAATPGLQVTAVASRRPPSTAEQQLGLRWYERPQELLDDSSIDVVVIATPPESHCEYAQAALEAGHHVVVEKPFALDGTQARAIARTAERCGRTVTVFQNRRWDSCYRSIQREIGRGTVGRVTHFESHFDRYRPEVRVRWKEAAGVSGGVWSDLGPHLVDQTLLLFGKPEAVTATLAQHRDDAVSADWAHVVLHYPGLEAILHASMLVAGGSPRFRVHGTDGSLRKDRPDPQESRLIAGMSPLDPAFGQDSDPLRYWNRAGEERCLPTEPGEQVTFYRQLQTMLACGTSAPVTLADAIATMDVMDAVQRAARERRTVNL